MEMLTTLINQTRIITTINFLDILNLSTSSDSTDTISDLSNTDNNKLANSSEEKIKDNDRKISQTISSSPSSGSLTLASSKRNRRRKKLKSSTQRKDNTNNNAMLNRLSAAQAICEISIDKFDAIVNDNPPIQSQSTLITLVGTGIQTNTKPAVGT